MLDFLDSIGSHSGSDDRLKFSPEDAKDTAKKVFGITHLKDFQLSAIRACFERSPSLVIRPTGAGKSLCFQLPAMMKACEGRFVLVISPLVSLMQDQVESLRKRGIGKHPVVFASPEYLLNMVDSLCEIEDKLVLLAVDE
eukprot:Cvel_27790.t1-p1 / transcript=Cvel_27790.t1 / gene=Cvel_27790 / organism=Chromera_velia_CCMP2878 / gene_product=ATP-dependent DNA helicase Q-like 5, putative / transcript_product=ATP-dependent DNA helicase Q-like 5, putative / location=Cvel_scaffold3526:14559-15642(+) / protein_length=139 / sequence_SO=supercontig / SO=protein_coding / is_pseudo=false